MNETMKTRGEQERPRPVGLGPVGGALPGMVTVSSGPYSESLPVADSTVGEIRARLRDRFDLPPNSQAMLDGNEVGDDVVVRASQALTFVRQSGEKGMARRRGSITIMHGRVAMDLPVAGLTVREIRARCANEMQVHPSSPAMLNGTPASEDDCVEAGSRLAFVVPSGEMGPVDSAGAFPPNIRRAGL